MAYTIPGCTKVPDCHIIGQEVVPLQPRGKTALDIMFDMAQEEMRKRLWDELYHAIGTFCRFPCNPTPASLPVPAQHEVDRWHDDGGK